MDDQDERLQRAALQLAERMTRFRGRPLNQGTIHDINRLVKDHRRECRSRGIDFPDMVGLVLTDVGYIELVRRDLEPHALQIAVRNIIEKIPRATPEEIARAVRWAFPNYRPGHLDLSAVGAARQPRVHGVNGHGAHS